MFERITNQTIVYLKIQPEFVAFDGGDFTSNYADKYC